jgi:hypothetical protein
VLDVIRNDRLLRRLAAVGIGIILIIAVLYISPIYKAFGNNTVAIIYDLTTVFLAGLATVLMGLMWRTFERGTPLWIVWGTLTLGMLLWTVGEVLWAYNEIILEEDLYPSIADAAWVAGYIPLFIGFSLRFRSLGAMPSLDDLVTGGGFFLAILIVGVAFVLGPIATENYGTRTEQIHNIIYPVGDLALAFAVMLSVIALVGGALSYPWTMLAVGFLVTSAGDLMYSYATWNDYYFTGSRGTNLATYLSDVPYLAAYVVIAFAMIMQVRQRKVMERSRAV